MNRDNVLFSVLGLLLGFIAGYILHEEMTARQPARRVHGAAAEPLASPPQAADPQAGMQQVQELRAYVEQNPDDEEAVLALANLNYDIQNWPRAIELYERYLELAPGNVDVMTDLGVSHRSAGDSEKALELFRAAHELDPQHWPSRFNEVIVLAFDLQRFEAAREGIQELQQLQPGNPDVARLAEEVERLGGNA